MRSPGPWAGGGGSALSMTIDYNLTQLITIDLQNTDTPFSAKVSLLTNDEFPEESLSVPYGNMANGTFGNGTLFPWEYTEFRMDWNETEIKKKNEHDSFPSVPAPLYFKHWSNGNPYSSQGPPKQPTVAHIGWSRMFFNTFLMKEQDHARFDALCRVADACLMSDMALRGSSLYPTKATLPWKQLHGTRAKDRIMIWITITCIIMSTLLLL